MRETSASRFVEGGTDRERVFRAAARHSRFVRFCRAAIPVTLVLTVGTVAGLAYFKPFRMLAKLPIDPTKLVLSGTKITMEAPHLGGYTRDGRPYDLTARAAAQDLTNQGVLELTDVHAHVAMQDKSTVEVKAATGVYDTRDDMLSLHTDVVITSSTGYSAKLDEAKVDIRKNTIVSDKPVEVKMTSGTVNANHLDVSENGDLIHFDKGVEMNLVPQPAPNAPPRTTGKAP
ncbi:MAG TPA: LPS export ABC transporter periplasmic protein LptC [Xanthobacteraceae bacterium]|nr:LPS export ABC transporter periplasmic protein LptC [Xanthobacteraceae bacterium]